MASLISKPTTSMNMMKLSLSKLVTVTISLSLLVSLVLSLLVSSPSVLVHCQAMMNEQQQQNNNQNQNHNQNQNNNNNNNNHDPTLTDSWSIPGSSGSYWWSSSASGPSSDSSSDDSSAYSAGSSFFKEPNSWHDAGRMKTPFAHSCSTFTRLGNMRFFGGYLKEQYVVPPKNGTNHSIQSASSSDNNNNSQQDEAGAFYPSPTSSSSSPKSLKSTTTTEVTVLSKKIFDLRFPTTQQVSNYSLPHKLENITGLTSCSMNQDTGDTFVMAGNTKDFSSSAVYMFSDNLVLRRDISLPFKVNRSSIAATVIKFEAGQFQQQQEHQEQEQDQQERGLSNLMKQRQRQQPFFNNNDGDDKSDDNSNINNSSNTSTTTTTTTTTFVPTTTTAPPFIPDAVVIGGEDQPHLWGVDASTGYWKNMCSFGQPLCDCVVLAHPFEYFVMACNDCKTEKYNVFMANLSCGIWDAGAPRPFTAPEGLQYVQGITIGKFSVFAYRVNYGPTSVNLLMFDHELDQWISTQPDGLFPARTHGALFSWLGRLQMAGGEPLGFGSPSVNNNNNNNNNQKQEVSQSSNNVVVGHQKFYAMDIVRTIQDLPIIQMNNVVDLDNNAQNQFYVGDVVQLECPPNSYIILTTAPNCLHLASDFAIGKCNRERLGSITLHTAIQEAYLCISPGTCKIPPANRSRCEGANNNTDFAECSGRLGCCYDHERYECFQYSTDFFHYGAPYFYLLSPRPISVVPAPTAPPATTQSPNTPSPPSTPSPHHNSNQSTPNPSGPNNNNNKGDDSKFLRTTTGKVVVIGASSVIAIAVIVAVIMHCTSARRGANSSFCLHEFVSKRYEVLRELGRGGFGTVYLAVRKSDQKSLALKVIACSNDDDVQCALMEFQLLRDIKPHPGMMQIIDIHLSWDEEEERKKKEKEQKKRERALAKKSSSLINSQSNLKSPTRTARDTSTDDDNSPTGTPNKQRHPSEPDQTEPLLANNNNDNNDNTTSAAAAAASSSDAAQGARIEQQRYVCIVMEYYEEGDLANFVAQTFQKGNGPSEAWLWTVLAKQLFGALAHLHSQKPHPIVHRDIKPENILLASRGNRIVITDFGLAASHERTFMSTRAGSFHYLAPECWSHRYTASVDVWSAGCILYASATSAIAPPLARVMFNDARHPSFPNEIRDDLRGYSPDFANLILTILKMDPNQRPTAAEVYDMVCKKCELISRRNLSDEDTKSNAGSGSVHMTDSEKSHATNTSVQW